MKTGLKSGQLTAAGTMALCPPVVTYFRKLRCHFALVLSDTILIPIVNSKFEAIPDDYSPEDILMMAKEAAKDAADELTMRRPSTKVGANDAG